MHASECLFQTIQVAVFTHQDFIFRFSKISLKISDSEVKPLTEKPSGKKPSSFDD